MTICFAAVTLAATALAACFPPLEEKAEDIDADAVTTDTLGQDTSAAGDAEPQDTKGDTALVTTCSALDRVCVHGAFDVEAAACVEVIEKGQPCDDGNPCTRNDRCDTEATCTGTPLDCDDGVACSVEHCSVADGGCVYETSACACSVDADCADGKPCTNDVCDAKTWTCVNDIAPGSGCNDFDPCTVDDVCDAVGKCTGAPQVCDDTNVCTTDSCDPGSGECTFISLDAVACDDGDVCSEADFCVGGSCRAGYLASFRQDYAAWFGMFARSFYHPAQLDDGSYVVVDRVYCDGPCFSGLQLLHLTSSGVQVSEYEWDHGPQGTARVANVGWYDPVPSRAHSVGLVVAGAAAYVLDNQSFLTHVDLTSFTPSWNVGYASDVAAHAWGLTAIGDAAVLLGDAPLVEEGPRGLWLGWVDPLDGSISSSQSPSGGEGLRAMVATPIADGLALTGTTDGPDGDDVFVVRLDSQGAIAWKRTYPAPFGQAPVAILATSSAVGVVARSTDPVDGTDRLLVIRVAYNGDPISTSTPLDAPFTPTGVALTPTGGYLVIGQRPQPDTWRTRAHVAWLDAEGALLGEKDGLEDDNGYTSVFRTGSGYVLTGSSGNPYFDSGGVLEVTDFDLNTPCDPTP